MTSRLLCCLLVVCAAGCGLVPHVRQQPVVRNPFPQLSRVAVAPFFNLSSEPAVDGRQFALAYYNELQLVGGFEVVPMGVVEKTLEEYGLSLASPRDARKAAQLLGVDVVVVGAVTDFSPYYPPRCGLRVEWYAAHPCFKPIPPGYGLPWGTPAEEEIPEPLVFEAQMAMAQQQWRQLAPPPPASTLLPLPAPAPSIETVPVPGESGPGTARELGHLAGQATSATLPQEMAGGPAVLTVLPQTCQESEEPVLRHTRTYNGHDVQFTHALENYLFFRNDTRVSGCQAYLQRSDDFIRFCCHLHLMEMLSARGGAAETRVVWRWPGGR